MTSTVERPARAIPWRPVRRHLKLAVNLVAHRDVFVLTRRENERVLAQTGMDRPIWISPFALRNAVRVVRFQQFVTFVDVLPHVRPTPDEPTIRFLDEIIRQKRPYSETTLFHAISEGRFRKKRLGAAKASSVPLTPDNFVQYYDKCMRQAESIARGGLEPRKPPPANPAGFETDVGALIAPTGEMMFFRRGNHRLGIARALGLDAIPVRVYVLSGHYLARFTATRDLLCPWRLPDRIRLACRTAMSG